MSHVRSSGVTEFSTTPEEVPLPWALVAIPGTLLVLIAFSMKFFYGLIAIGFCYGAMYLLTHSKQASLYRTPARFRVSKTGVEVGGTTLPKTPFIACSCAIMFEKRRGFDVVANPTPNSGQQNVVSGMNWAISKLGPISYRVDVEARGVPTTLAGGLTEPTASAIMTDVSKLLELG